MTGRGDCYIARRTARLRLPETYGRKIAAPFLPRAQQELPGFRLEICECQKRVGSGKRQIPALRIFSVPFHDVENGVLADSEVMADPAVASPFADRLQHFGRESVQLRPPPGLSAELPTNRFSGGQAGFHAFADQVALEGHGAHGDDRDLPPCQPAQRTSRSWVDRPHRESSVTGMESVRRVCARCMIRIRAARSGAPAVGKPDGLCASALRLVLPGPSSGAR